MNYVEQPDGSSLCGQACVAMVADVSLAEAVQLIGKRGHSGTRTRDLVKALRSLGVGCADKLKRVSRVRPVYPRRAILAVAKYAWVSDGTREQRKCHWMVTWDGVVYDPGGRWPNGYD